jgi:hypothetical protein
MAAPFPASIFALDDLVEEALFKARSACARVEVVRIAAEGIVASAQHPMTLRDWSHPEPICQSVRPVWFAGRIDYSVSAAAAGPAPQPTTGFLFYDLP